MEKLRHFLHIFLRKIKGRTGCRAVSSASSSFYDATIINIYHNLLKREPNEDELIHWNYALGCGTPIRQIKSSLKLSYEYEQLKNRNDIVLVNLPTFKLFCRSSDLDVGRQIIHTQSFEPYVASTLKDILKSGDVFVDLGANIGYFSLMASTLVGPIGKIISFEPNVRNVGLFYASIIENNIKNIVVMPVAASDTAQIHKLQSFGSNGFLGAPTPSQSGVQYIQSVVLDEILFSVPRIDAIKMDIEGFEPFALRGMLKLIEKHKPIIVTEFSPWHIKHRCGRPPQEYLDTLTAIGYRLAIIESSGRETPMKNPAEIIEFWSSLQDDKMQLDLIARPSIRRSLS